MNHSTTIDIAPLLLCDVCEGEIMTPDELAADDQDAAGRAAWPMTSRSRSSTKPSVAEPAA